MDPKTSTFWCSFAVTSLYVLVLYIKPIRGNRDSVVVIKSRLLRVSISTMVSLLLTPVLMVSVTKQASSYSEALGYMGLSIGRSTFKDIWTVLKLFVILFNGSIAEYLSWGIDSIEEDWSATQFWQTFRNLVAAPLTEELTYRSCLMGLYGPWLSSPHSEIIYFTPLFFGLAHITHALDARIERPQPMAPLVLGTLFRTAYTTFFGILANLIFVRSNSIWPCVAAHAWCNFMGFPLLAVDGHVWWKTTYYSLSCFGIWYFYTKFSYWLQGNDL
ncbi:hypothetical protein OGAPHI_000298 [Ogataea philodendri]|uniref:intramembrane prenyl-peptidase Rce1 n=1 Tax=Ogataea philodendri TaxID=1378263 RepID=A0A9P8PH74_9ASCO|nr:uncharacterized protein OGAPHI_000298 [Ogataea philodendri]KAH3671595.1 hypothetical protein OGAPHI_000298 [Ogataea philodendri]